MSTWQDYFYANEEQDGIRLSWNVFPSNKTDAAKLHVPVGLLYTPLKEKQEFQLFTHPPIICSKVQCAAVINRFCQVDFNSKTWKCCFCRSNNAFPREYSGITEQQKPAELLPMFSTISYTVPKTITVPLSVVYVVDTTLEPEYMAQLKVSLISSLSSLSSNTFVSLITFNQHVLLHDLDQNIVHTSFAFNGGKDINLKILNQVLFPQQTPAPNIRSNYNSFSSKSVASAHQQHSSGSFSASGGSNKLPQNDSATYGKSFNRFLQLISSCDTKLVEIINELGVDAVPSDTSRRPSRCVGAAVSLAVHMLEQMVPKSAARILLFLGGPCTFGPGKVVEFEKKQAMRSHQQIYNDQCPFLKKANNFYESLAKKAAENGHAIDLLIGHLDQVGLYEMRHLTNLTGGYILMSDDFTTSIFKQSFARLFERNPVSGDFRFFTNATISIKTTSDFEVRGCIGHCVGLKVAKENKTFTHPALGIGETNHWKICSLDCQSTYSFVLEQISNTPTSGKAIIQLQMNYENPAKGTAHLRVTTISRDYCNSMAKDASGIAFSFDQDAAAVLLARIISFSIENGENPRDVMKKLDRTLIKVCQFVAAYNLSDPASFSLPENFLLFPQHLYHLRRSMFLQFFNISPDEVTYNRHYLNREDAMNASLMFQPVLYTYSCNQPPEPALLDASSIKKDVVLFMDSFFHVLIYHGEAIMAWREQNYHLDPAYASFAAMLEGPKADAEEVIRTRFPVPRYVVTEAGGSGARFLLSKVNPSRTQNSQFDYASGGTSSQSGVTIFTDDIALEAFIDYLKKLTVAPS